jgi:hypothetical protein
MWRRHPYELHWHNRLLTLLDLCTAVGIALVLGYSMWIVAATEQRVGDLRNAIRSTHVNQLANALAICEVRTSAHFGTTTSLPVDRDPHTAQVVVTDLRGVTCELGTRTTPNCPGAQRVGLHLVVTGQGCAAYFANGVGEIPLDPYGLGAHPDRFVPSAPIGAGNSGYYVNRTGDGRLEIGSCESENGAVVRTYR